MIDEENYGTWSEACQNLIRSPTLCYHAILSICC